MSKKSKRFKKAIQLFGGGDKVITLDEAFGLFVKYKEEAKAKFDETVGVVFKLAAARQKGKKIDQSIRGSVLMPNGIGKSLRVAVFTRLERFDEAKNAGAVVVGDEELIERVKGGKIDFDVCIATPDMMAKLAVIGKVLGPRNLMPNPKLGTVTDDITFAVKQVLSGRVEYKADSNNMIHAGIGKLSFSTDALSGNFIALASAINSAKPSNVKGTFLEKAYLTVSQGPSLMIDITDVYGLLS